VSLKLINLTTQCFLAAGCSSSFLFCSFVDRFNCYCWSNSLCNSAICWSL